MNEALIRRMSQVIDPTHPFNEGTFDGTFDDAVDTAVAFAYGIQAHHGENARHQLTDMLRHSDPDRVAEVCAGALLRLAGEAR